MHHVEYETLTQVSKFLCTIETVSNDEDGLGLESDPLQLQISSLQTCRLLKEDADLFSCSGADGVIGLTQTLGLSGAEEF